MIIDKEWRDKVFDLLPWANVITQDLDGTVLAWAEMPKLYESSWYNQGDESFLGTYLVEGDWKEMIFEREKSLPDGYRVEVGFEGNEWDFYHGDNLCMTIYTHMNYAKAQAIEAFNRMVGE